MTVKVCVLYFAKSAELTGVKEEQVVSVPTPISSLDLWGLLVQRHPRLSVLKDQVVLAVRQQYVSIDNQVVTLVDGDEVAVVPPLSEMAEDERRDVFKLSRDWLSVQEVVDAVGSPTCGAISLFIGTTREDELDGRKVIGLEYEAYELMAQSEFKKLCEDIRARWPSVQNICVHHRLGWVEVGQASVVMAISSPHRHDGQQAIQHGISQLKAKVPIWKKEVYDTQDSAWKQNVECAWAANSELPVPASSERNFSDG